MPTFTACRASASASITVAPHRPNSCATVDLPLAILPVSPTRSIRISGAFKGRAPKLGPYGAARQRWPSQKGHLIFIDARHLVAMPAPRFVRLAPATHERRRTVPRRTPIDDPLIAAGGAATDHANGVELVHELRIRHQLRHRTKGLTPEVGVGPRDDDAQSPHRE